MSRRQEALTALRGLPGAAHLQEYLESQLGLLPDTREREATSILSSRERARLQVARFLFEGGGRA